MPLVRPFDGNYRNDYCINTKVPPFCAQRATAREIPDGYFLKFRLKFIRWNSEGLSSALSSELTMWNNRTTIEYIEYKT